MMSRIAFAIVMPIAQGNASGPFDILLAMVGVLVFVALLIGVVAVVRKRFMAGHASSDPADTFSLGGLRDLVRQGKMTQEEYDMAKAKIVEAHNRATARAAEEGAAARQAESAKRLPPETK